MTLGEVLERFKQKESAENIVPLVNNDELTNGIVAWKSVVITYSDNEECSATTEAEQWEWMWSKVEFNCTQFAVVAGVPAQDANKLFTRLKGLRLIYPDGTIHTLAAQYLQAVIMAKLPKNKGKK